MIFRPHNKNIPIIAAGLSRCHQIDCVLSKKWTIKPNIKFSTTMTATNAKAKTTGNLKWWIRKLIIFRPKDGDKTACVSKFIRIFLVITYFIGYRKFVEWIIRTKCYYIKLYCLMNNSYQKRRLNDKFKRLWNHWHNRWLKNHFIIKRLLWCQ